MKNQHSFSHSGVYVRANRLVSGGAILAGFILFGAIAAHAQSDLANTNVASRFPEPNQVAAAYPDIVQRFVALRILDITLNRVTTGRSPGAYDKGSAYMRAIQEISTKYDNSAAANEFSEHVRKLGGDTRFRQSVLERYHLADLATAARPVVPGQGPTSTPSHLPEDPERTQANRVLFPCGPIWLGTLILMGFVPRIVWKLTGKLGNSEPPSNGIRLDSGQLPDSLREFKLFGFDYDARVESGKVIEEKTWSETYVSSVTTPATYQVVGDTVYRWGGGTTTSSTTVTKDRIWVKTPNKTETAWTFSGGKFVARHGHVLSGITQPNPDGTSQFLIAYNHSTGQAETYQPRSNGQKKLGTMLPWIITTLPGAAGFILGTAIMFLPTSNVLSIFTPTGLLTVLVIVVRGGFVCLIGAAITARIMVGWVRGKIENERGRRFTQKFKTAYIRFLNESTPAIVQSLADA